MRFPTNSCSEPYMSRHIATNRQAIGSSGCWGSLRWRAGGIVAWPVACRRRSHALDDRVNLLLIVEAVSQPSCVGFFYFGANRFDGDEVFVFEHGTMAPAGRAGCYPKFCLALGARGRICSTSS